MTVGGDYSKENQAVSNAAASDDGGISWHAISGLGGFRSLVAVVPGTKSSWIAVGPSGADLSSDDGRSWQPIEGDGYHTFAFAPHGKAGWGAGEKGRIARLTGW